MHWVIKRVLQGRTSQFMFSAAFSVLLPIDSRCFCATVYTSHSFIRPSEREGYTHSGTKKVNICQKTYSAASNIIHLKNSHEFRDNEQSYRMYDLVFSVEFHRIHWKKLCLFNVSFEKYHHEIANVKTNTWTKHIYFLR